uniref:Ovule protein n=1 Tax=Parascaris univalens TaxID=6257 RepID=A0A915C379_PARUN
MDFLELINAIEYILWLEITYAEVNFSVDLKFTQYCNYTVKNESHSMLLPKIYTNIGFLSYSYFLLLYSSIIFSSTIVHQ